MRSTPCCATWSSRVTAFNFDTPLRLGSFNWQNSIQATDQTSTGLETQTFRIDDPASDDPADSITVNRTFSGDFASSVDWNTGINLPILFRGSWKLQPSLGISNTTGGPFMLRNRNTNGDWVHQGKRFRIGVSFHAHAVRVLSRNRAAAADPAQLCPR